ncbi:cob(I)yrinic acid a,c-diamide adenosyltransferase [Candidatus Pacearchaeota archaeon CG10_big_fil_rev_8_21_14_0_10_31_24]|nr:MAG: cob(I)yrinic acid a,c-diamide adenosyltransferase [Candidatus Pacearchaeota archaeon CG10_big_fil_rev_8_21_14_0_10_31_24]
MDKSLLGHVQILWGNGKGKTTSALGTCLRACGNGCSVHLVQFMKNGTGNPEIDYPGEIRALEKFKEFTFKRFGTGSWVIGAPTKEHIDKVQEALNYLKSCMGKYDIIIADEVLYAIQLNLLSEEEVIDLIKNKPKNQELILTGSHLPYPNIFEHANLVTEIKKHKHPYDSGIKARKGIEY